MSKSTLDDYQFDGEYPWRDKELMKRLYWDEKMTQAEIADLFGCGAGTVSDWLRNRHELGTRSISEAKEWTKGYVGVPFYTARRGYERWEGDGHTIKVHRIVAAAEYGFDAVADKHVHHKNGIPWDNRPENLELLSVSDHSTHHKKLDGLDRIRVAELYENGDISYRRLHDILDYDNVSWFTIMGAHKDFYGDGE